MSAQRVASALLAVFVAFSIASPAEEKIGIPPTRVVVVKLGLGTGTVTSVPAGIDCGAVCEAMFPSPSSVTLTATPSVDSSFGGWGRVALSSADHVDNQVVVESAPPTIGEPRIAQFSPRPATPRLVDEPRPCARADDLHCSSFFTSAVERSEQWTCQEGN